MKIFILSFCLILSQIDIVYSQWTPQNSGTTNRLMTCFFINQNTGWAAGYNGTIVKTTDGGINWISQSLSTTDDIHSIFFVDSLNGWMALYEFVPDRHGSIEHSTDGGETWVNQLSEWGFTLHKVIFTDINNGYALGSNGILYKTNNSGQNWYEISPFNSYWLYSAFFFEQNIGWIGGGLEGYFLRTTDGGQNWSWLFLPTNERMMDIFFSDENLGWACGAGGKILRTTNGGLDWLLGYSGINVELRDIQFIVENKGWSVGLNGVILHTIDSGTNWYQQNSGASNNLYAVYFFDDFIGWVVGDNGIILTTINGGTPVEFISFTAELISSKIILNWSTVTETNNRGFEIERKNDNSDWSKFGFVPGYGTTTEKHAYQFIDHPDKNGNYSYRLKQIDFDGAFEYSSEVAVEYAPTITFALEQNYPNPFNPVTKIRYSIPERQFVTIQVYNSLGELVSKLVNEEKEAGVYEIEFNGSNLPSGVYFYIFTAGNFTQTKKLILMK